MASAGQKRSQALRGSEVGGPLFCQGAIRQSQQASAAEVLLAQPSHQDDPREAAREFARWGGGFWAMVRPPE